VTPLQPVVCHFHTRFNFSTSSDATADAPSPAKLQYEVITLSKCGEFDKALKLLDTLRNLKFPIHSNMYCALLNHAKNHHKENVFNAVLDYINKYDVPHDIQLYTVKIAGNLKFFGFDKAMVTYGEMINKGHSPQMELLNLLFENCLQRNDTKNSIFFYNLYLQQSILPPVHLIIKFITMCLNERLHSCVMKLLQFYAIQNIPLDENLVYHLKWYFDSNYDER